jgi:hypothetical protein
MPGGIPPKAISTFAVEAFLVAGGELLLEGIIGFGFWKFASVKDNSLLDGPEEVWIMCVSLVVEFCTIEILEELFRGVLFPRGTPPVNSAGVTPDPEDRGVM